MKLLISILSAVLIVGSKDVFAQEEVTTEPGTDGPPQETTLASGEEIIPQKPVEYCSKSEIMTSIQEIDYAWTLSGALTYIVHLGQHDYQKMDMKLNISDLKFHEDKLPGNWSFAVYKRPRESMTIEMTYEMLGGDHLTVNGEVVVRLPCGTLIHPELSSQGLEHYDGPVWNGQQYNGNFTDNYHRRTIFNVRWTIPCNIVKHLMDKRRELDDGENNSTETNAPMSDEIDLHFHIEAVKTLPTVTKLSTDCKAETVKSLKKKESSERGYKSRYSYSTPTAGWGSHSTGGWSG